MIPDLRRATPDDLPAMAATDGRAFGAHFSTAEIEDFRTIFEPERFVLATDPSDKSIVGVAGSYAFDITLPGGAVLPAPGVTWVSVAATHRRRGILRRMMLDQHSTFLDQGAPLSILTASEASIYGRFGYGPATRTAKVEIDRRLVAFRSDAPDPGGARFIDADEARTHAPDVHRRWCAVTPGAVSRSEAWWDTLLPDRDYNKGGATALFYLAHPDGYVSYRRGHSDDSCRVEDFFAATPEAHAALWRVLLGMDLVEQVRIRSCPLDDPLPFLLTDSRLVRTTGLADGLWARVLDVPAVLSARRYATEVDVVIDVEDAFLGRGGRFRLRGGPDGATCEPTGDTAQASFGIATLGALLFGAHTPGTFARAGLLTADPSVVGRLNAAFVPERLPVFGTNF
ncbi:GNAT family N-acetyltransferase [Actinomycetes bacterium KLBMP 9759]